MDTALSVAALVVSLFSAGFTLYTFIWTKVRDRKQATLEAYNRLQEQVLDHLNVYMPKQIAEIAKNTRSEEYKQISAYVARIEHLPIYMLMLVEKEKSAAEMIYRIDLSMLQED